MTTLTANPAARQALDRRKLEHRLELVRGRAEALPQLNLGGLVAGATNRLGLLQFKACADALDDIDSRIERHMEALKEADMAAASQAQEQHLAASQGVETFADGSARSRDGWRWLKSKGRLTAHQSDAGDRYAALHRIAHQDTLSTSANDNGGTEPTPEQIKERAEAHHIARQRLIAVQAHIYASTGSDRLVMLLDCVCGRGDTLRVLAGNDDRKAGAYEAELRVALDMAGVAFKLGAVKKGEAA